MRWFCMRGLLCERAIASVGYCVRGLLYKRVIV